MRANERSISEVGDSNNNIDDKHNISYESTHRWDRIRAEGETGRWGGGLSCSWLMRSSEPIWGDINSRLRVRVHSRYNRRRVRQSAMGLSVPVCRNAEVSHLGGSVESVVIDRVRTGRVRAFITGLPDVVHHRSALEARRRNYSIRHNPDTFSIPLGAVLEIRMSNKNRGKNPFGYSHMEQTRPGWWTEPKPTRWSVKTGQVRSTSEGCSRSTYRN